MVVQHNMQAANANRMLGITTSAQSKSTEKLSSGYKINRAADDAAGLAISEKMRSQVRGLDRASTNAQDGISVVQTAEGALNEVHSMLQRMNELATQAANDTNTTQDRSQIQLEVDQLTSEINRVSSTTQFNTMNLLDGNFTGKNLQVGSLSGQTIELNIGKMSAEGLGLAGETTLGAVPEQHATLTASDVTAKAAATAKKKVADIFDGTPANTAQNTKYIYDKARDVWHKDGDPTGADAGIKLKANFTADDGATYTFGTNADGTDATVTGINEGGAKVTDIQIVDDKLKGLTDGVYKWNGTDKWVNQSDSTKTIAKDDVKTGAGTPAAIDAAAGSTITLSGYKAKVDAGTKKDLTLKVDSFANAGDAMDRIQKAIDKVSTQRASLGAVQNRLEHTIANLDNVSENTQSAESRIRDTDMAKEMVQYSKNNILAQAGQSMLAQANQSNQGVLSLLQ
ncbi:MAG: flagellin [Lachnospiraceae bacterium]|nr:flagellin [Lachnospiraceae bacterium]